MQPKLGKIYSLKRESVDTFRSVLEYSLYYEHVTTIEKGCYCLFLDFNIPKKLKYSVEVCLLTLDGKIGWAFYKEDDWTEVCL